MPKTNTNNYDDENEQSSCSSSTDYEEQYQQHSMLSLIPKKKRKSNKSQLQPLPLSELLETDSSSSSFANDKQELEEDGNDDDKYKKESSSYTLLNKKNNTKNETIDYDADTDNDDTDDYDDDNIPISRFVSINKSRQLSSQQDQQQQEQEQQYQQQQQHQHQHQHQQEKLKQEEQQQRQIELDKEVKEAFVQPTIDDTKCPYCSKVFTNKYGRLYHINKFVCRQQQLQIQPPVQQAVVVNVKIEADHEMTKTTGTTPTIVSASMPVAIPLPSLPNTIKITTTKTANKRKRKVLPTIKVETTNKSNTLDNDFTFDIHQDDDDDVVVDSNNKKDDDDDDDNDDDNDEYIDKDDKEYRRKKIKLVKTKSTSIRKERMNKKDQMKKDEHNIVKQENNENTAQQLDSFKSLKKKRPCKLKEEKNRTCPTCHREFTSIYGLKYHIKNLVCSEENFGDTQQQNSTTNKGGSTSATNNNLRKKKSTVPFYQLHPGSRFVTKYGIVEVIDDTREIPTITTTTDTMLGPGNESEFLSKCKMYNNWLVKRTKTIQLKRSSFATISLTKRKLLNNYYTTNTICKQTIFKSYYGDEHDPKYIDPIEHSKPITTIPDPKFFKLDPREPIGSYPNRIVTCHLIQDLRPIIHIPNYNTITTSTKNNKYERVATDWKTIHPTPQNDCKPIKLYLQRRTLTEQYNDNRSTVQCIYCGHWFSSINGFRYHVATKVCIGKNNESKISMQQYYEKLNNRVEQYFSSTFNDKNNINNDSQLRDIHGRLKFGKVQGTVVKLLKGNEQQMQQHDQHDTEYNEIFPFASSSTNSIAQQDDTITKQKSIEGTNIKLKNPIVYVFENVKDDGTNDIIKVKKQGLTKIDELKDDVLLHPGEVYQQLLDELYTINGSLLGSIYPSVFLQLQFAKPKKPKRKLSTVRKNIKLRTGRKKKHKQDNNNDEDDDDSEDEREEEKKETAKLNAQVVEKEDDITIERVTPLPPIVDIRVCIGECDAGRYPSVQRNVNRVHETTCAVCHEKYPSKDIINYVGPTTQTLYQCIYCTNVVHYCCMLTKFTVKEPEADDEFMCYSCIRIIQTRRNRAEKRRILRLQSSTASSASASASNNNNSTSGNRAMTTSITATNTTSTTTNQLMTTMNNIDNNINNDINQQEEMIQLTKGIVIGKEYECVAAQGKLVNDVTELLYDTHKRLSQQVITENVNQYRLFVLEDIQKLATL